VFCLRVDTIDRFTQPEQQDLAKANTEEKAGGDAAWVASVPILVSRAMARLRIPAVYRGQGLMKSLYWSRADLE